MSTPSTMYDRSGEPSLMQPVAGRAWQLLIGTGLALATLLLTGCSAPLSGPVPLLPAGAGHWPGRAVAYPTPGPPLARTVDDPFYTQPSAARLRSIRPGTLIRFRPLVARAYRISHVRARGWQLMYRSNDSHGQPVAIITTILVPPDPLPRLLSYQVAYDALNAQCAPSQETLRGTMIEQLFVSRALRRHWVVTLPDYEGPNEAFGAGRIAGQSVLDGIRATRTFLPRRLLPPDTPVALWGYSGGAFASLWAGELAATYAPDIQLAGIASGGAPANLLATARHIDGGMFAGIYFEAVVGLSRAYPSIDTEALLNKNGRAIFEKLSTACLGQELAGVRDPLLSGLTFAQMRHYVTVDELLDVPAIRAVARSNRLGQRAIHTPTYYYQAWFDQLTPRAEALALARTYCRSGTTLLFDWALGDHVTAAFTHADDALAWLSKRFNGAKAPSDCAGLLADAPLHRQRR
ncbi:MAG: hypothetical protein PF501_20455 [Salinisphaera sp.]|jgi:hypothetical protein|nr:hypothetical protein [Salinisphaera sp.]